MIPALALVLAGAACWLLAVGRPGWRGGWQPRRGRPGPRLHRTAASAPEALPRLVRQIASLLAAGRTGPALWRDLAHVLIVENGPVRTNKTGAHPRRTELSSHGGPADPGSRFPDATLAMVLAVERAASLGMPVAPALRGACRAVGAGRSRVALRRGPAMAPEQQRMWLDVAACFDVCAASGAPVADVLGRLAATIEAEHDAVALRETALAGPRATARLLNWLPFTGLGLGMVMGVDPVAVLLGGPPGWALLAVGLALVVAGRAWSSALIAAAARPADVRARTAAPGSPDRGL